MPDYSSSSDSDHDLDYWDFPSEMSYLPVSNVRDTPWSIDEFTQANRNRRERCFLQPVPPGQIVELPKIYQISGGFLRENGRVLYTANHSSVLRCLDYARTHWRLPANVTDGILALAALETFLHPFDPAHWLFWRNEQKDQSAKLVQSHIGRRNPTIYHPLSWSVLDWKFRLSGIHNKQLPNVLSCEPWYDTLVLSTYLKDLPIRGPVLRKRKVQPSTDSQTKIEHTKDPEQLSVKRPRMTRTRPSYKAALLTDSRPETENSSMNIPNLDWSINFASTTSIASEAASLLFQPPNLSGSSGRASTRMSLESPKDPSARASSSTSSPTPSSVALPPPEYSRTRSSSRLSARTLVDDIRDLSPSTSSATTAADSSSAKGKQKSVDELVESKPRLIGVIGVVEEGIAPLAKTFDDEDADFCFPRLTRSRSGASKTETVSSGLQRSHIGRKNRARNINPYSSEKAARGLASANTSAAEMLVDSEPFLHPPTPKRSRKVKNSRR
ncbi:hypothetical protein J3R30DRAFT_3833943 [Lentinula aciculospora]|uniref:Uncharacterized protein n=1 Tax=Lentinula aciculospora TaxID=153920 RepID=A0A9W9AJK1_9AGAR|nr:hypothetical protein J3R30DRAFT_3833943 [Lentinula aciculospora]